MDGFAMSDKYLVIGASSFSGKAFCEYAREKEVEVVEISRPTYDLNLNNLDIANAISDAQPDYVVNFAALNMVAESWEHYADYYQTNVIALARLAGSWGGELPFKKWIQISTPEVYGAQNAMLTEHSPYAPSTPYAVSRAAFDMHLHAMFKAQGFPAILMRSVNVYGEGQQPYRIIPKTVLKILRGERLSLHGGGTSVRSFIHIRDIANSILCAAQRGVPGEVYHTSSIQLVKIRELVEMICSLLGASFEELVEVCEERPGKDHAYILDSRKARAELKWADKIPLGEGLPKAVAWFKEHAASYADHSLEYQHKPQESR